MTQIRGTRALWFGVVIAIGTKMLVALEFTEVTDKIGITAQRPDEKYGGPCVADIDGDGHFDLLLSVHRGRLSIYYGAPNGMFTRHPSFKASTDVHGVAVARRTATSRDSLIIVSTGSGLRDSAHPDIPRIFLSTPNRTVTDVSTQFGFGQNVIGTSGRVAVFLDLSQKSLESSIPNGGGPDVLFTQFLGFRSNPMRIQWSRIRT